MARSTTARTGRRACVHAAHSNQRVHGSHGPGGDWRGAHTSRLPVRANGPRCRGRARARRRTITRCRCRTRCRPGPAGVPPGDMLWVHAPEAGLAAPLMKPLSDSSQHPAARALILMFIYEESSAAAALPPSPCGAIELSEPSEQRPRIGSASRAVRLRPPEPDRRHRTAADPTIYINYRSPY